MTGHAFFLGIIQEILKMTKAGHRFDWLMKSMKILSFAILAFVLVYEIFVGVSKLNAKEMTYTSTTG